MGLFDQPTPDDIRRTIKQENITTDVNRGGLTGWQAIGAAAYGGGRSLGQALGGEDPRIAKANKMQEAQNIMMGSGLSPDDPEFYKQSARVLQGMGLTKEAMNAMMQGSKLEMDLEDRELKHRTLEADIISKTKTEDFSFGEGTRGRAWSIVNAVKQAAEDGEIITPKMQRMYDSAIAILKKDRYLTTDEGTFKETTTIPESLRIGSQGAGGPSGPRMILEKNQYSKKDRNKMQQEIRTTQKAKELIGKLKQGLERGGESVVGVRGALNRLQHDIGPQVGIPASKKSVLATRHSANAKLLKGQLRVPLTGPGNTSQAEWKIIDEILKADNWIASKGSAEETLNVLLESLEAIEAANQAALTGKEPPPRNEGPQPGDMEDGYIFRGGNPADPNNWEKQ